MLLLPHASQSQAATFWCPPSAVLRFCSAERKVLLLAQSAAPLRQLIWSLPRWCAGHRQIPLSLHVLKSLPDKQADSHLLLRLEVVSFVLPCVRARRPVHRALGTPGCLLPPSISLPGQGTKRRHGRSWAWTCRFSTLLWWHLKTSVLESQYLHLALFLLSVQLGVSPLSAFPCKAALLFSLGISNRSFTPCMKLSNLTAQWGSLANSPEFCHTELDKTLHMVIRE